MGIYNGYEYARDWKLGESTKVYDSFPFSYWMVFFREWTVSFKAECSCLKKMNSYLTQIMEDEVVTLTIKSADVEMLHGNWTRNPNS